MNRQLWVLPAVLAVAGSVAVLAQTSSAGPGAIQPKSGSLMMQDTQASIGNQSQQMMGDRQAADQKLQDLVAAMNAAQGTDKVDAIAKILTELVADRAQMGSAMMPMQGQMMQHMEHMMSMQQGMMGMMMNRGAAGGMTGGACPMMQAPAEEETPDVEGGGS